MAHMPRGPFGQKRPGDVIGAAIKVAKIATGEVQDESSRGKEYAIQGGKKGGPARAQRLTAEERSAIARDAARTKWQNARTHRARLNAKPQWQDQEGRSDSSSNLINHTLYAKNEHIK